MLDKIYSKIRALVEDFLTLDSETFTYVTSSIFTICESNITSITEVTKNGVALGSGVWAFDSDTNKITITESLTSGDIIEVDFKFNKYSDTELDEYVRASLVWISIKSHSSKDYELEDDDGIYPTPDNQTTDLISLISSILIKPNYDLYRLPNLTVRYPKNFSKDQKIEKLIDKFETGLGVMDLLEWN